ncbi:hypothetical protein ACIRPH_05265 [Nocardiopsis sp. NPDC101807]|uniref:hypothetical protein n=1 Tax=Nocardiopsis sp. NPDC101807 TaxID=3364339 RepID=UPI003809409C
MEQPSTLTACAAGHSVHYPAALDTLAQAGTDLAFCVACECQQVHVITIFAGDLPLVVASGGPDLFDRFKSQGWPEHVHVDEAGKFSYRVMEPLDLAGFLVE